MWHGSLYIAQAALDFGGLGHPSLSAFQGHEITGVCPTWFTVKILLQIPLLKMSVLAVPIPNTQSAPLHS